MEADAYCVKTDSKCSETRCNICPRYTYSQYGVPMTYFGDKSVLAESKPAYPLDAPQPYITSRCTQEDYQMNMFDGTLAEDRAREESLECWAKRVIREVDEAEKRTPDANADAVVNPPHYTKWQIEPINFIMRNNMPFWMGNVVKYCMRADDKNGVEDLRKAIRYIEFRIRQLEGEVEITR